MNHELNVKAADGSGSFSAFIALPENAPAPAVIVIQEIFGVNANMRNVCNNLAQAGYIAICPDLFWRLEPDVQLDDRVDADMQSAFGFFQKFNLDIRVSFCEMGAACHTAWTLTSRRRTRD